MINISNFGENNWIDARLDKSKLTIQHYSKEFEREASVFLQIDSREKIDNLERLNSFCKENRYTTNNKFQKKLTGQIRVFVNPLHGQKLPIIASKSLNLMVTEVTNSFKIWEKNVVITADFLSESEKTQIKTSGHIKDFDNLDLLALNLFNPWAGPGEDLSFLLARIICGMAEKKANILYTFKDTTGAFLKIKINSVTFKKLSY